MGWGDGSGEAGFAGVSARLLFGTPIMTLLLTISTGVISRIEDSGLEMGVVWVHLEHRFLRVRSSVPVLAETITTDVPTARPFLSASFTNVLSLSGDFSLFSATTIGAG